MKTPRKLTVTKKASKNVALLVAMLFASVSGFSQETNFSLGDPDATGEPLPPGVPLDDNLHIVLIIAGIALSFFMFKKFYFRKAVTN